MQRKNTKQGKDFQIHREIGERIRYIRKEILNLNQYDFSNKFNISSGMVSSYENGKHPQPVKFLVDLSRESGINIIWLTTGEGVRSYDEAIKRSINKVLSVAEPSTIDYEETKLQEIIDFCRKDSDTLDTFWHFIKAKKGFRSL